MSLNILNTSQIMLDERTDCKSQINQLTIQVNCILTYLDQTKDINPKHTKRGIIHLLFMF